MLIALIPLAYLVGAVPFAMILAKLHGVDIRSVGSGNVGATNLSRALGKKWGYVCFVLDVLKGLLPMLAAKVFVTEVTTGNLALWLAAGSAAILGHIFPVYLKFRGGKGVATSFGVVLGLYPYFTLPGLIAFVLWASAVLIWKYISLASILAAVAFPVSLASLILLKDDWRIDTLWPLFIVAILMPALVIYRHRTNITRLLKGTESKITEKKHAKNSSSVQT